MQEHEQQPVDSRSFPADLSQWFATPLQQASVIYTSQPTSLAQQQQSNATIHIPIMDKSITTCETTDSFQRSFVGYIVQSPLSQNQHQILEIQNIPAETINQESGADMNSNSFLSVLMVEPKIKDASTNTEEKWEEKKTFDPKAPSIKPELSDLRTGQAETVVLEQRFYCQFCGKDFANLALLMDHDGCTHNPKIRDCVNCSKTFPSNSHFLAHKCVDKIVSSFLCRICNVHFSDREVFSKHEESHRSDSMKKLSCDPCGLNFSDANVHKRHLKIHSGNQYVCSVCEKMFPSNASLTSHKRVHFGERPYKCEVCGKRFFTKSHAQTHRRVHSGERPFACNFCGRAFADGSSYRRHERLHQQNKKYQCEICGRGFPLAVSLSKHLAKQHSYKS